MRKVATAVFVLILSGLGTMAATEAPKPVDKPRTMDDVIDRVITNENRANQQIKQYSPLVETYIQHLKPDKDLGYAPAGDKYFLGRADFSKGVSLVSLLPMKIVSKCREQARRVHYGAVFEIKKKKFRFRYTVGRPGSQNGYPDLVPCSELDRRRPWHFLGYQAGVHRSSSDFATTVRKSYSDSFYPVSALVLLICTSCFSCELGSTTPV